MEFATKFKEKEEFNQYWYSPHTIEYLTNEIVSQNPKKVAFLSTPSLYYSCEQLMNHDTELVLFDYDTSLPHVIHYDFNSPESIEITFQNQFDYIVIDPPFITEEVWRKYTKSIEYLRTPHAKILLTTICENKEMIQRLLQCTLRRYQPSIPHLVYQYGTYANYISEQLDLLNPEIPQDD